MPSDYLTHSTPVYRPDTSHLQMCTHNISSPAVTARLSGLCSLPPPWRPILLTVCLLLQLFPPSPQSLLTHTTVPHPRLTRLDYLYLLMLADTFPKKLSPPSDPACTALTPLPSSDPFRYLFAPRPVGLIPCINANSHPLFFVFFSLPLPRAFAPLSIRSPHHNLYHRNTHMRGPTHD